MNYAADFKLRRDMIWKAISSHGNHIKDPVAYLNRMEKRYGYIVKQAAGISYEYMHGYCLAEVERLTDERLSAIHGWQTQNEMRNTVFQKLKSKISRNS